MYKFGCHGGPPTDRHIYMFWCHTGHLHRFVSSSDMEGPHRCLSVAILVKAIILGSSQHLRAAMPGYKQRFAIEVAGGIHTAHQHVSSPLADALLSLWTCGQLSAVGLQTLANAAVCEGICNESVVLLAAIGTFGHHPQNCHRDLISVVDKECELPQGVPVVVPALDQGKPTLLRGHLHRYAASFVVAQTGCQLHR